MCGGGGGGEGRKSRGGGGILFGCSTRDEVGVGWSLFLGILGWEGEGEDH